MKPTSTSSFPFVLQRVKIPDAEMAHVDTAPQQVSQRTPRQSRIFPPVAQYNPPRLQSNQMHCSGPNRNGCLRQAEASAPIIYRFIEHALHLDE